jgi:hypothetical protein
MAYWVGSTLYNVYMVDLPLDIISSPSSSGAQINDVKHLYGEST